MVPSKRKKSAPSFVGWDLEEAEHDRIMEAIQADEMDEEEEADVGEEPVESAEDDADDVEM